MKKPSWESATPGGQNKQPSVCMPGSLSVLKSYFNNRHKLTKKVINPRRFGLSPSSVGVKFKLMYVGEFGTKPYFKIKFEDARATSSNKTEVGVEAARLTGAQFKNEAHLLSLSLPVSLPGPFVGTSP